MKKKPRLFIRVNYLPSEESKEGNGPIIRPHSRGNGQIVEDINLIALQKRQLKVHTFHIGVTHIGYNMGEHMAAWAKSLLLRSSITKQ